MAKEAVAPIIPDLNRKEVRDRKDRLDALDFNAFGRFRCALRLWDFFVGDKGGKFYKAEFVLLGIEPDASELAVKTNKLVVLEDGMQFAKSKDKTTTILRVGERSQLLFNVQRGGTATDPKREERDDAVLADFVATLFKTKKNAPGYDSVESLKELNKVKKFDSDALQFVIVRRPQEVEKELKDPESGAILKTYKQVYSRDSFEIVG